MVLALAHKAILVAKLMVSCLREGRVWLDIFTLNACFIYDCMQAPIKRWRRSAEVTACSGRGYAWNTTPQPTLIRSPLWLRFCCSGLRKCYGTFHSHLQYDLGRPWKIQSMKVIFCSFFYLAIKEIVTSTSMLYRE